MPPVVLGIDTSSAWCSAALVRDGEVFSRRREVGHAHSAHLLTMIDEVLREAAVALAGCHAIAFGAGPGSFTGLRVACAAAQGLAFGAGVPVAAIGTLEAIAHSVIDSDGDRMLPLLVAQDARMGELYWTVVDRVDGRLRSTSPPALDRPESLVLHLRALQDDGHDLQHGARPVHAGCGNAWAMHGDALDGLVQEVVHRDAADAIDVAALGVIAYREGRLCAPEAASPVYVRNDVARTTAERAALASAKSAAAAAGCVADRAA